ncbi:MAG: outer membrane beta-barrel protein [Lysobacterales bacterium]
MKIRKIFINLIVLGLAGAFTADAQEAGINIGILQLYPTFGAALGYDDNLALSQSNAISSRYRLLEPGIRADLNNKNHRLRAQYRISDASFSDSPRDDFTDQFLDLSWRYTPTVRSDLQLSARWHEAHDRRGEGLRENFVNTLDRDVDEYRDTGLGLRYTHGAPGARGRLALFAETSDKRYENNRDFTAAGDYDSLRLGGEFGWRMGARTTAILQASQTDINYDLSNRDAEQRQLAVGLLWDGAPRTDARVLIGRLTRSPDSADQPDFSGAFWEAVVNWRPVERTAFSLLTNRSTDEAFGNASFLVREKTALGWRHQWLGRLSSAFDVAYTQEDLRPGGRQDDIVQYGVSLDYTFRRWLLLGVGLRHVERDSNNRIFDYRRNEILLSAQLSL